MIEQSAETNVLPGTKSIVVWVVQISYSLLGEEDDEFHDFMLLDSAIKFIEERALITDGTITIYKQEQQTPYPPF